MNGQNALSAGRPAERSPAAEVVSRGLRDRPLLRVLSAGLHSAALAAVASRPWGLGVLALVAYVPAFDAVSRSRRVLEGAVVAGVASLGVATVGYEATVGIFPGAYFIALVLAPLPYALLGAVTVKFRGSAVIGRLAPAWRSPLSVVALAILWCVAELLPARPELFGLWAFPLGAIGYSQVDLATAQLARFSSVTAVSAFVLLLNAALVVLWRGPLARWLPASLALLAGSLIAAWAVPRPAVAAAPSFSQQLTVRLVQPNLPDSIYAAALELDSVGEALDIALAELIGVEAASTADRADLTLLPEASWPGVVRPSATPRLAAMLAGEYPVLFGAVSSGWNPSDRTDERFANSVMLLDDNGLEHVYAKRRLVPIAESPLRAGSEVRLVETRGFAIAPFVCYDVVFPADVRTAARSGAEVLAVFTDDSFAARSDVPALHLRVARLRAIETGLPVALVSNTGPSALISHTGELLAATRPLEATTLTATLRAGEGETPYVRYGDWVGGSAVALSLGIAAMSVAGGGASELDQGPT